MSASLFTSMVVAIFFFACSGRNHVESQTLPSGKMRTMAGGRCEDCDLMFAGMPNSINHVDTTEGWTETGQQLEISGTAYHQDGRTPAADVILYYYHTDQKGYYAPAKQQNDGARKHGRLRGWVKTDANGTYHIYTCRPAQYPDNKIEAHIHVLVKEPDIAQPYWIDAWVFDDDPYLTPAIRQRLSNHGGNGIMKTVTKNGIQIANQNVYLGQNIPGYPSR